MADAILAYDPLASSLGFSALGFFGSWAGGGDTEDRKGTTAIKYRVSYANFHFGLFGQVGGYEQGNAEKGAYQGDVGADFRVGPGVLSTDVIAGRSKDAVSVTIVGPTDAVGHPVNILTPGFANAFMSATLSDNTNVMVDAKYTRGSSSSMLAGSGSSKRIPAIRLLSSIAVSLISLEIFSAFSVPSSTAPPSTARRSTAETKFFKSPGLAAHTRCCRRLI